MDFDQLSDALVWLDSHVDFESKMPTRRALPSLDRMAELSSLLGDPQSSFPSIHITGTNGKGSTSQMATALLSAMGLRVGTYTSPNLARVNERIALCGEPIRDQDFSEILSYLSDLEGLMSEPPTRFELLTAAALRYFSNEAVDVAVVEVGLGGTWDCTNVVDGDVAVVTNISFDHTDVLGPRLEDIAFDKSGIVKATSVVVIGETNPALVELMVSRANDVGARSTLQKGHNFSCDKNVAAIGGRELSLRTEEEHFSDVFLSLHGAHQGENAACALQSVEAFLGAPLGKEVVQEAFGSVEMQGRLEVMGRHPLRIIDGAHNAAGMGALASALLEGFLVEGEKVAVVGMLEGRNPKELLSPLLDAGIGSLVACAPRSPRAIPPNVIGEAAKSLGFRSQIAASVEKAVEMACQIAFDDGLIVVCGSLYVVSDARTVLLEM